MTLSAAALVGRAILMLLSFVGLCAAVRTQWKVDRFIAPYAVACGTIIALMLGGMLHVLAPVFWVLYAAGFLGLIYAYGIRREKPEYGLIALLALFAAFLVWRFYFCPLHRNDDVSHWGLVARHLLRHDSFPDADTKYVFFQSYPLGTASFIYYIGKTIAATEGVCLVAQELLQGILFLPLLSHIRGSRRQCFPAALAVFLVLFSFFRNMVNLQVDLVLAYFGLGIAASAARYRDDLKKALPLALLGMIAVVYVKNSGLFFAFTSALLLGYIALRCKRSRRGIWASVLLPFAAAAAAYLLWIVYIRLSYPAALDTKHAVSLSAYAAQAESKGVATILQICRVYLKAVFTPTFPQACALAFMAGCAALLVPGAKKLSDSRLSAKKMFACLCICAGVYILWALMVLGMYIFSMPTAEALAAASFYRYNGTGLSYMMGLAAILFFAFFGREEAARLKVLRVVQLGSIALVLCFAVLSCLDLNGVPFAGRIFERNTVLQHPRTGLAAARSEYSLPDGGAYLVYCTDGNPEAYSKYYYVKYEFESNDIHMIAEKDGQFLAGTWEDKDFCTDLAPFLESVIDQCDAVLVMDASEPFEAQLSAFLQEHPVDVPVIRTYEY